MSTSDPAPGLQLTARLAEWIAGLRREHVPEPVWAHAILCLLDALGIGATQCAGLYGARMGAMTKRFHAGRAAQSGVIAAVLARRGFTGSRTALEQPTGGFFSTLCDGAEPEAACQDLGSRWELLEAGFKAYASCASTHTTVDAIERLMQRGLAAANLARLRIFMSKKGKNNVGWKYAPAGVVAAQMNGYYTAAVKLLDGVVFIEQFEESRLADPAVLALIERISVEHDPALDAGGAAMRHAVRVEAELTDGRTLSETVEQRRGSSRYPLSHQEVESKFRRLAQTAITPAAADEIVHLVSRLEDVLNMERLAALLR